MLGSTSWNPGNKIKLLLKDSPIVLAEFRKAIKQPGKRNDLGDNVTVVAKVDLAILIIPNNPLYTAIVRYPLQLETHSSTIENAVFAGFFSKKDL